MKLDLDQFTSEDLAFGKSLTDAEGWGRTEADWGRLLALEPKGMISATADGAKAGIAGLIVYGRQAWLHSVIVRRDLRGRGIGRRLVTECMDMAQRAKVETVFLDSVHEHSGFYESLGFEREFDSLRFSLSGTDRSAGSELLDVRDLGDVQSYDKARTGIDRGRVIEALWADGPGLCFLERTSGAVSGYIMARPGEDTVNIGPCVADDEDVASRLLHSLLAISSGLEHRACVPGANERAVRLMGSAGAKLRMKCTRMRSGPEMETHGEVYCMSSPEKG